MNPQKTETELDAFIRSKIDEIQSPKFLENIGIENELIILSKQTFDLFLAEKNASDIIAVYSFYYYTAKWQKTNQVKAVDSYVMKGLHMGSVSFKRAKKFLLDHELIQTIRRPDPMGKVEGWYIKINFIWKNENVSKIIHPLVLNTTSGEKETNALNANNINALNANNITPTSKNNILTDGQLPENRGKTYVLRVLSIYRDLFHYKYGFFPDVNLGRFGKSLKSLATVKTELQISAMLIVFFNWRGVGGSDDFAEKKLIEASHNFSWFFSTVNTYEIYLRNVLSLDLDNEQEVKAFVGKHMLSLVK